MAPPRCRAAVLWAATCATRLLRQTLRELSRKFPGLTEDEYLKFSIAIDGTIIHTPLLETFEKNSELVFIPKIAGG